LTIIQKSEGTTPTEQLLSRLCEQTFLKLWSYPNPCKDDGKELCDLLVVFDSQIFIFFDREKALDTTGDKDPKVSWERWKRGVIEAQIKTAKGAERYLASGRPVFLDTKKSLPFPMPFAVENATFHKFIVAHGAAEACKMDSDQNVSGSLAISYSNGPSKVPFPFFIDLDKDYPVHILDSHSLPLMLSELDTIYDFTRYLSAKLEAIKKYEMLMYCGEEDLLAHYFLNFNKAEKTHFIGTLEKDINALIIGEGEWADFVETDVYINTKKANKISYLWDEIIQKTSEYALEGRTMGRNPLEGKGAIQEMAKEPRFMRRALSSNMFRSIENFTENPGEFYRSMSFMPSFYPKKAYIFMQLKFPEKVRSEPNYREKRQAILAGACGSAKNNYPDLEIIVGILIEPPKHSKEIAEDFAVLYCSNWGDEDRKHYEKIADEFGFFKTGTPQIRTIQEFVHDNEND